MKNLAGLTRKCKTFLIAAGLFSPMLPQAQAPQPGQRVPVFSKQITAVANEAKAVKNKLNEKTHKFLSRMEKLEKKLYKKLQHSDTALANGIVSNITQEYKKLNELAEAGEKAADRLTGAYLLGLDSLTTGFAFLHSISDNVTESNTSTLTGAINNLHTLQSSFNASDKLQRIVAQRKQLLEQQLQSPGLAKQLKKIKQQVYYYRQQVAAYKDAFSNSSKVREKIFNALHKIPAFSRFFQEHSQLAAIFQLPGSQNSLPLQLSNLQTRAAVVNQITNNLGTGLTVQQAINQNLNAAQAQVNGLKNKLSQLGGGNTDTEMPDFKPNNQKVKTFFQRIETGFNLQSQKSNSFLPASGNIGISIGYKLNDKSIIGIGAAYKMGWSKSIGKIHLTNEGLGVRSFVDYKLKGSIWLSGGAEYNYNSRFKNIEQLKNYSAWQQSILLGLSKKMAIGKKATMNMQLLFDGLYRKHIPATQPLLFRIGYHL